MWYHKQDRSLLSPYALNLCGVSRVEANLALVSIKNISRPAQTKYFAITRQFIYDQSYTLPAQHVRAC